MVAAVPAHPAGAGSINHTIAADFNRHTDTLAEWVGQVGVAISTSCVRIILGDTRSESRCGEQQRMRLYIRHLIKGNGGK